MLADDLAALHGGDLATCIGEAQRFVLKPDAVTAATNVSLTKPASLRRGIGICKLPFETVWLEWSYFDQRKAESGTGGRPGRIGILINADEDLMGGIGDVAFWPADQSAPLFIAAAFRFDYRPGFIPVATVGAESSMFQTYSLEDQVAMREILLRHQPFDHVSHEQRVIVANQALLAMSFIMLLNTRNSVVQQAVDITKLNRARAKAGKVPLFGYRTVDLSLSRTQRNALRNSGMDATAKRAHLVRGHFKVRKSGVFWWMPHLRGDLSNGFTDKHYEVRS